MQDILDVVPIIRSHGRVNYREVVKQSLVLLVSHFGKPGRQRGLVDDESVVTWSASKERQQIAVWTREVGGVLCILFEKLEALSSGHIICFVESGVSEESPPPLCRQFRGEAVVQLSRFHTATVLNRVDFWGCHTSGR